MLIRKLIRSNPSWGRTRLSEEVCDRLDWYQPNGRRKDRACRVALLRLEALGFIRLPKRIKDNGGMPPRIDWKVAASHPRELVNTMPDLIEIKLVSTRQQSQLWNAIIDQHHYLGLATPVGRLVRYLVQGDDHIVGAISFSEPAWEVAARSAAMSRLGIHANDYREVVFSNNRFLILPDVDVPNLASRVLSISIRQAALDWRTHFGSSPLVAETFVDPSRFAGTSYLAANWLFVGRTKGYAKSGASHHNQRAPKLLFMRGIGAGVHRRLRLSYPPGASRI